jgi:prophage antirepressor-like protein
LIEDKSLLSLDNGYEGLFVGDAVVKAIEYKNYINGESKDVE